MRREGGRNVPLGSGERACYPYLDWASEHFFGKPVGPVGDRDFPLTWEAEASQARYGGMDLVDPVFSKARLALPHAWHAAEMFLTLLDDQGTG
jgi:hypothetical protein